MIRDVVQVLSCASPTSMVVKYVKSSISEEAGIYNCVSTEPSGKWSEEAIEVTRHWLTKSQEVWFDRMNKATGLVFFRDPQGRIINAKEMLVELKLAKKFSFVCQSMEHKRIKVLKQKWVDLHDLTIDYSCFKELPCKRVKQPESHVDDHQPEPKKIRADVPEFGSALEAATAFLDTLTAAGVPNDSVTPDHPIAEKTPVALQSFYKFYPGKDPIFVYGQEHLQQYTALEDVPFPEPLKKSISHESLTFQMHIWPRVETGGSAIIIEPLLEKKFIFEPVVFNHVFRIINSSRGQSGPLAVVIVDTRFVAQNLLNYFHLLNEGFTTQVRFKALLDAHDLEAEDIAKELRCDVLILTLPMLMSLRRKRVDGFELNGVEMLVFKNVHNMVAKDLQDVWVYFHPLHKKRVMVTSRSWMSSLKKLYTDLSKPIICFGSPIEVALKENMSVVIKLAKSDEEQLTQLIDIVKQSVEGKTRTAIVCLTPDALHLVQAELERSGIEFYALGETPREAIIVLMLDKHLKNMIVDTVDVLVHYSVPKWKAFSNRFVLFEKHILARSPTKSHVLLNINDYEKFLPDMEYLLSRTSLKGAGALSEMFCAVKQQSELLPANRAAAFCESLPFYGECPNAFSCPSRHTLNENDVPDGRLPIRHGSPCVVELKICSVVAPNHFMAEVIPKRELRDQWARERLEMKLGMSSHFADKANRVAKADLVVGDLCAIHVGQFRRARICHAHPAGKLSQFRLVHVQCLETGNRFMLREGLEDILELPERFREPLPQMIDVYLLGVVPKEFHSGWCPASVNKLKQSLRIVDGVRFTVKGAVAFTLGKQIYLKTLKIYENLACGVPIVSHDVVEWLLSYNLAVSTDKGLKKVQAMIDECQLYSKVVPEVDDGEVEEEKVSVEVEPAVTEEEEVAGASELMGDTESADGLVANDREDIDDAEDLQEELNDHVEEKDEGIWEDDNHSTFEYVHPEQLDFDDNFDGDELELLAMMLSGLGCSTPLPTAAAPKPARPFAEATIEEITVEEGEAEPVVNNTPMLKTAVKFPEIYWSQSDAEIKLRIVAPDVEDFDVEMDTNFIELCLSFSGGDLRGGVINLFGEIDPDASKVELRGLNIIVTIAKALPGVQFQWPRLLETKQPVRWLKFYHKFDEVDKVDLNMDLGGGLTVPEQEDDWDSLSEMKVDMTIMS